MSRTVSASSTARAARVQRRAQRVEEALHEEPYAALRDAFTLRQRRRFLRQRVEKLARKLHGADWNGQEREREQKKCRPFTASPPPAPPRRAAAERLRSAHRPHRRSRSTEARAPCAASRQKAPPTRTVSAMASTFQSGVNTAPESPVFSASVRSSAASGSPAVMSRVAARRRRTAPAAGQLSLVSPQQRGDRRRDDAQREYLQQKLHRSGTEECFDQLKRAS